MGLNFPKLPRKLQERKEIVSKFTPWGPKNQTFGENTPVSGG